MKEQKERQQGALKEAEVETIRNKVALLKQSEQRLKNLGKDMVNINFTNTKHMSW